MFSISHITLFNHLWNILLSTYITKYIRWILWGETCLNFIIHNMTFYNIPIIQSTYINYAENEIRKFSYKKIRCSCVKRNIKLYPTEQSYHNINKCLSILRSKSCYLPNHSRKYLWNCINFSTYFFFWIVFHQSLLETWQVRKQRWWKWDDVRGQLVHRKHGI